MDQRALWLSSTFAAAKIAMALWCGQLALSTLDRRRATLGWQITLAALAVCASWWAVRTTGATSWWPAAWVANGILSAAVLVDCVRRWLSATGPELAGGRVHGLLTATGLLLSAITTSVAVARQLPLDWLPRAAAVMQVAACAGMLGMATAVSLELTLGALGPGLLNLRWRRLAQWMSLCWAVQLALSGLIVLWRREGETPVETATPVLFAFGMLVVGYIAWSIPRRMVVLAGRGRMEGQVSLAIAGWLAVICLSIACGLPPTWPWSQLAGSSTRAGFSASAAPLAIVKQ